MVEQEGNLNIEHTRVFSDNLEAMGKKKIIVNEGGTRSSKTISLAQLFIYLGLTMTGKVFSVCRATLPALRASAMKDFENLLRQYNLYSEATHNKSDHIYTLNGNEFEFFSLDDEQKLRGRKRDYLWLNEANESTPEHWLQLRLRTSGKIFMDYNPSDEFHYIYDEIIPREDCTTIHSTYKDNPFLEAELVEEIESLNRPESQNAWKVYGLGLRGKSEANVYQYWEQYDTIPTGVIETFYGCDYGYTNPSALVVVYATEEAWYVRELYYERKQTTPTVAKAIKKLITSDTQEVYTDNAIPDLIEQMNELKLNAKPAVKEVLPGINSVKTRKLYIHRESANLLKEIKSYKNKTDKKGNTLEDVVKFNDHALDAMRYGIHSYLQTGQVIQPATITFSRRR